MNYDILDDDGSFGATVLVPGDVLTTSVALTTTFAESVTPTPPPPTSADDCPNDGSALSTLLDFSSPVILAAVVSDLRKHNSSLLLNLALNLPSLKSRQTHPCVNCSVSEYNALYCGAAVSS